MNLRDFKKDVEFFVGEFVEDCYYFIETHPDKATEEVVALLEEAVDLHNGLKDKACEKVEGNKKLYFAGLRKELFEKVDALYEKLGEAIVAQNKPKAAPKPKAKAKAKE
ncbi:MAG: hypothetical protein IJR01_06810 [Bacteroidales bacterium]|nr:hypothetical protein [Bacteroidales bacterium]